MRSENVTHKLIGIEHHHTGVLLLNMRSDAGADCHYEVGKHKPILRKLSDITDEEKCIMHDLLWVEKESDKHYSVSHKCTYFFIKAIDRKIDAETFHYLITRLHVDLFGLIESGLAIDRSTPTPTNNK